MPLSFYGLGLGEPYPISSMTGTGTGDLLDEVIKHFPTAGIENPDAGIPRIAILGRPNVGKSSFLNVVDWSGSQYCNGYRRYYPAMPLIRAIRRMAKILS